jgi:hypothetical protein
VALTVWRRGMPSPRIVFVGDTPELMLTNSVLWGYGGLLSLFTAIGLASARNYLIVAAPVMALWGSLLVWEWSVPWRARAARTLLACFCALQALIGFGALAYVHQVQTLHGEYGPTWRSQQPAP